LKLKTPSGWLLSLLQSYQASEDFRQLAQRTRGANAPRRRQLSRCCYEWTLDEFAARAVTSPVDSTDRRNTLSF
jgi:hypothetical protein